MSTTTTNYGLVKPALTDAADITAMNQNWDAVDTKLKALETADSTATTNLNNLQAQKVSKSGDTMTGALDFTNTEQYRAISKTRNVNSIEYYVNWGCGVLGGEGVIAMELHLPSTTGDDSKILGRLEVGSRGVSFQDANGKRTYLHSTGLTAASVE